MTDNNMSVQTTNDKGDAMPTPQQVVACIDGSRASPSVCDSAAWASQRLQAPVTLFHVLDHSRYPKEPDLSGNIGLGSREHLLTELAELDRRRAKLGMEQGNLMLEEAAERLRQQGVTDLHKRQRHGSLAESLRDIEDTIRLVILGLHGETSTDGDLHVGSQLETVIRTLHCPIVIVPDSFKAPRSVMLAFDGSPTVFKGIELLSSSPIFRGMPVHLVMVGADTPDRWAQLRAAEKPLADNGCDVRLAIREGKVRDVLHAYQQEHDIDLLVMGAYGHSRIRRFLVGSTTTAMLETTRTPLVILR